MSERKEREHFNPLPRKEGDDDLSGGVCADRGISIHSLVKRETWDRLLRIQRKCNFNPLPRKEGDQHPQNFRRNRTYFNPLPRKEGDVLDIERQNGILHISIHSLVKRETRCYTRLEFHRFDISIHSLVKRETPVVEKHLRYDSAISIHSLVKRETTSSSWKPSLPCTISIHSLVKRETR